LAMAHSDLRATVGSIQVEPNAGNVIAGLVRASLDVRHAADEKRYCAVRALVEEAHGIGSRRGVAVNVESILDQPAIAMNSDLIRRLSHALEACHYPVHAMMSGAGHDAMILAPVIPSAMLFLRSPGGLSHCPGETVLTEDVEAALEVGLRFIRDV
jgi:allantoate deiminase